MGQFAIVPQAREGKFGVNFIRRLSESTEFARVIRYNAQNTVNIEKKHINAVIWRHRSDHIAAYAAFSPVDYYQ